VSLSPAAGQPGAGAPARAVTVVEVSPRDGLQNDPSDLPTAAKAELIARTAAAGLRRIEATSFVSPKAVPRMADAEDLVAQLRRRGDLEAVSLIGLVVNQRGVTRAAAAGVDEVNAVVIASDTFSLRNQGETTAASLAQLEDVVGAARAAGLGVSITIGAAFGCPFEGEVPLSRLVDVAGIAGRADPDEITLADTIGVAVPADVTARVTAIRAAVGPSTSLRAHFHNTRNTGMANVIAAVDAGVTALDASLGGIGGCPFAPAATGNIATEDLAYLLGRSDVTTGLSLTRLIASAAWLSEALGHPIPGMLSKAGDFPQRQARGRSRAPG